MYWLKRLQPPKYLRYFFYIAYNWYSPHSSEKESAHQTAAIFLTIPHMILILIFINLFFAKDFYETNNHNLGAAFIAILVFAIHYIWFLYSAKWKKYLKEFKPLTKKEKSKGTIYLIVYLSVILIILFPLSFLKVISDSPYYE